MKQINGLKYKGYDLSSILWHELFLIINRNEIYYYYNYDT